MAGLIEGIQEMRKLLAVVAMVAAPIVGLGSAASALSSGSAYPPTEGTLFLSTTTPAPGAPFEATLSGCTPGETVTFTLDGATVSATCAASGGDAMGFRAAQVDNGSATATLTAPTEPGTYTVSAVGTTSGVAASATITVGAGDDDGDDGDDGAGPGLPATGSGSAPIAQIAGGTLLAGLGLGAVAWRRRRPAAAA